MHKLLVAGIISRIFLIMCFVMALPLGWAMYDDIHSVETIAFSVTITMGLFLAIYFRWKFSVKKQDYKRLNTKDGLAIVGLSWLIVSLFGAIPLYLSQVVPTFTDALFEIASGFTTTGATVLTDIESVPRGILFWRSLTHWLGGMGIIVFYIAVLPALGANSYQLYKTEAPGITVERADPRIKETAKSLWFVYLFLSVSLCLLYIIGDMGLFDALCHTFATMATGGFSTKNTSMAAFSPYIQWVTIIFMFLAGVNFMLHYLAINGKPWAYFQREEFRRYGLLILFLTVVFSVMLQGHPHVMDPFRDSLFQVISIITTTGYTTVDFDQWPHVTRYALVMLMVVGGCGGSTGGGVKVVRFFSAIKIAMTSIFQSIYPNAVVPVKFDKVVLPERVVMGILSYLVIYIFLMVFGTLLLVGLEGCDLETGFTAALSAISNIGPGLSEVGAVKNFAWFSIPSKWLLTFLMLAGRLELYAILILFIPSTWRK